MQKVETFSGGSVKMAPGTLYGALENLKKNQLITHLKSESTDRRKVYAITELGRQVLQAEYRRLSRLVSLSSKYLGGMSDDQV